MRRRWGDFGGVLLSAVYWAFLLYLFVPLLTMTAMSFKDGNLVGFPIESWTARWYGRVLQDEAITGALLLSTIIAAASTAFALVIGTWVAVFLALKNLRGGAILFALMCLPTVTPGIVSAISMRLFMHQIALPTGAVAVTIGHTIHAVPFVAIMALTRLRAMPPSLVEAARDLGAGAFDAFRLVTLPYLRPALLGAGILSLLLSFDDFLRSFFLGGYSATFPVLVFARLGSGLSPEITAASVVVLAASLALAFFAQRILRRGERQA